MEQHEEVSMTDMTARGAGPAARAQDAGGGGPAPVRRRRMSAKRKQSAVLRLLRGEDLELVSRELSVPAAELSAWRDAFLAVGEASLKTRPARGRAGQIRTRQARAPARGQRAAGAQDRASGGRAPFGTAEVETMSHQVSPSTSRAYGILRVGRLLGTPRATLSQHRRCAQAGPRRRRGRVEPMPDEGLVEAIRELLAASPFHGEGHRKIWARLRFAGLRTCQRRVLP